MGWVIIGFVILVLLIKLANLRSINKSLRMEIMEMNIFTITPLTEVKEKHFIDGDADPLSIDGCTVVYHQKNGRLEWTGSGRFYANKEPIRGHELHEKLHEEGFEQDVLNRNYFDFMIKHLELIPYNWPTCIPFWGTVYRRASDNRCFIKCLSRRDGIYVAEYRWLDTEFNSTMPAIVK